MRPTATPRSRRPRRTPSTCRRTSTPASAIGRNRSNSNTASVKAARAEKSVGNYLHAQDYMVYAHLQLAQDKQARAVIDEMMQRDRLQGDGRGGRLRAGGLAGPLCDRPRRLGGRLATAGQAERPELCDGDHAFRTRARRGALRQAGSRQGRHPEAGGIARQAARSQGQLLVGRSSTSSVRLRLPGCFMRRASTTRRSRR